MDWRRRQLQLPMRQKPAQRCTTEATQARGTRYLAIRPASMRPRSSCSTASRSGTGKRRLLQQARAALRVVERAGDQRQRALAWPQASRTMSDQVQNKGVRRKSQGEWEPGAKRNVNEQESDIRNGSATRRAHKREPSAQAQTRKRAHLSYARSGPFCALCETRRRTVPAASRPCCCPRLSMKERTAETHRRKAHHTKQAAK